MKNTKKRWTILNVDIELKNYIVLFAKENGVNIATALKMLIRKEND